MLNFSSAKYHKKNQVHIEKIDLEIPHRELKPKLPRHISCLENKAYSQSNCGHFTTQIPLTCSLNQEPSKSEADNLAVNILKYQLKDRAARQKHLENLLTNLKRRLKVADANGNQELVHILQQEYTELATKI